MIIQTLFLSSAIVAAPQAQTPPRPTPETPAPPSAQTRGADKTQADVPSADASFVKKAAGGGMAEVAIAKLATEKAENAGVKAFAERMVRDHTRANTELKALAASKQIALPDDMPPAHKAKHDKLAGLSGAAFDRAFVAAMLDQHQQDVRDFSRAASTAGDGEVKAFAAETLPTLKEHLQEVQRLSTTVGKAPTS